MLKSDLLLLLKNIKMGGINKQCFVCNKNISKENSKLNNEVNLPVCKSCIGSEKEKETVKELLDSLADGLVRGCIQKKNRSNPRFFNNNNIFKMLV